MIPSFASALLVLAAVVKVSAHSSNGLTENLLKRASEHDARYASPPRSDGHMIKRAEGGKFARRHGVGMGGAGYGNRLMGGGAGAFGQGSGAFGQGSGAFGQGSGLGGAGYGAGLGYGSGGMQDIDSDGFGAGFGGQVAGGFGGVGGGAMSSSSVTQQQSTTITQESSTMINSVISGYSELLSQIQSYEQVIAMQTISAEIAMQQAQQLAIQFEAVISQFQACTICISQGLNSFHNVFSSLFTSFSLLVTRYQAVFPSTWPQIFGSAFGGLNGHFAGFLSTCQNAGMPVNSFMPPTMLPFFQSAGLTQAYQKLQQFGMSMK